MSKRDKRFFKNLSGFASGINAVIEANAPKGRRPGDSKLNRSDDDIGQRLSKQDAKLARRAAQAAKARK